MVDITLVGGVGNRKARSASAASVAAAAARIFRLKDFAVDGRHTRKVVVRALDEYAERYRGTRRGAIASRAAATIIAASMLEAYHEGCERI